MKKVWQTSSILQFREGVTFSMTSGLKAYFIAYQTAATYGKLSHVVFRVLKVAITHHNFVHWPVIWVQPKVDASLEGHNSGEPA